MSSKLNNYNRDLTAFVVLFSNDQKYIDEFLLTIGQTFRLRCDSEITTNNGRIAFLIIMRWLADKVRSESIENNLYLDKIWSQTWLMVESGMYAHQKSYDELNQIAPFYAGNWLILSDLCKGFLLSSSCHQYSKLEEILHEYCEISK